MGDSAEWIGEKSHIEIASIVKVENIFNIKFPQDYIEHIIKNDGGYPKPNRFTLNNNEEIFNNLLSFNENDISNILETYNDIKGQLIEKISLAP